MSTTWNNKHDKPSSSNKFQGSRADTKLHCLDRKTQTSSAF